MEERLEQIKHKRFFNIGGGSDQVFNFEDLRWLIEQAEEARKLKAFYDYFAELYGKGLEVAYWHENGDLEPFDDFFDCAEQEME